jgi:hypothetical protein
MSITREKLYEEVWAEPMTVVAARYQVSGNFLARVCVALNVPHPPRGYWAKLKVGNPHSDLFDLFIAHHGRNTGCVSLGMWEHPSAAQMVHISNRAVPFHFQLTASPFEARVQLIEMALSLRDVAFEPWQVLARDTAIEQFGEGELLSTDQLLQRDLNVLTNGAVLMNALFRDLGEERLERLVHQDGLNACPIRQGRQSGRDRAFTSDQEIEKQGWLANGQNSAFVGADDKQSLVECVATSVLNRRREHVEPIGIPSLQIPEHSSAKEIWRNTVRDIGPYSFEQRVSRRHPLKRRVVTRLAQIR